MRRDFRLMNTNEQRFWIQIKRDLWIYSWIQMIKNIWIQMRRNVWIQMKMTNKSRSDPRRNKNITVFFLFLLMQVFSGYDDSGASYGRFCGNKIPADIISTEEALLLRFPIKHFLTILLNFFKIISKIGVI